MSIEDSVVTIQDSMKLSEVKSVFINRFQEKNIVILIACNCTLQYVAHMTYFLLLMVCDGYLKLEWRMEDQLWYL